MDEDPPHGFNQTFVLKPLGDSFYVQHDMFRLALHHIAVWLEGSTAMCVEEAVWHLLLIICYGTWVEGTLGCGVCACCSNS